MPTTRGNLAASVVDGKIYAIGGIVDPFNSSLAHVEEFTPDATLSVNPAGKLTTTWGRLKATQ